MSDPKQSGLQDYDPIALVAGCAALLLDPRNADNADHLGSLAAAAQRTANGEAPPDWEALLPTIPGHHLQSRWEPHETVWVEPLAFIDGPFLVFTDGNPEVAFGLRMVLGAVFKGDGIGEAADLRRMLAFCLAVLRLSTHLANAAGAGRYEPAISRQEEGIVLPPPERFSDLQGAVTFNQSDLEAITGVGIDVLAPLIRDLDADGPIPNSSLTGAPSTELFPLLRQGERFVVVSPGSLAAALRHRLIIELLGAGQLEQLRERLWDQALAETVRSFGRLGWEYAESIGPDDGGCVGLVAFTFGDLVTVASVLIDGLDGYDEASFDSIWHAITLGDVLEEAMSEAEKMTLFGPPPRPRELMQVVVLSGVGRSVSFGLPAEEEEGAPRLMLSLEALTTISYGSVDNLELWKFAEAGARLREGTEVLMASPLDEFAAWREMGRTFYFSDDRRPTAVHFDSSYGRALREKTGRERDVHAVVNEGSITEVIRLAEDPEIPVFVPLIDLFDGGERTPRMLVEIGPVLVWVRAKKELPAEQRPAYAQMVDCIAYWLWQLGPSLPVLAEEEVELEVVLEHPEVWRSQQQAPEDDGRPVAATEIVDYDQLRITVFPQMARRLDQPDNNAERDLAAALLAGLSELAEASGYEPLTDEDVRAAVELHAPLGPKKKINLITDVNEAALLDGPLPPVRYIQDPDPEQFLDEAGRFLRDDLELPAGPIAGEQRGEILNAVVAHHLDELAALVATISPDGLLEYLIDHHEAQLHRRAISQIKYPSEAAAYGAGQRLERLRREIPDSANAGVALRFLIEYVAACPPRGLRPISLDLFDRLLALASQIANRGWSSDIVKYGHDDGLELSMLESGRLGLRREDSYFSGQENYLDARTPSVAEIALRSYRSHWGENGDVSEELLDRLDVAALAEWGVSMRELGQIFGELSDAAFRRRAAACAVPRSELLAELSRELGFDQDTVDRALGMLTLGRREDFLTVPKPFNLPDIYPWRFNREMSHLRRPLVLRETTGEPEVVWGPRHIEAAGQYLLELVTSERLKAKSSEMRNLMTSLRQEDTFAFVEEVARRLRGAGLIVQTNVEKVKGQRVTRPNGTDPAGDLDILAADPKRKVLHVREAKDLEGARTPAELSNELEGNFSVGGEKRSAADRHLERIAWVEGHLDQVLEHLGIDPDPEWRVAGGFIVDIEVLSPYIADCPLPITPIDRLLEEMANA